MAEFVIKQEAPLIITIIQHTQSQTLHHSTYFSFR